MIYFNKLIDIYINRQESQKVVDNYFDGTNDVSVRDFWTDRYENNQKIKSDCFLLPKNNDTRF